MRRPHVASCVLGFVAGVLVSAVIASWLRPDAASHDVAKAITLLRGEMNWLEARRKGLAKAEDAPAGLRDERPTPGPLSDVCTRQYFVRSSGNVVSGYSVSILEVKSAADLCRLIERGDMYDEFEVYVQSRYWVVVLWK
jgi:hypothetical protein